MAVVAVNRIDARLIHGQVATGWIKFTKAELIIVMDNAIATDPFMTQIFMMACPPGRKLKCMTAEQVAEGWKKDQLGTITPILLLTRDVPTVFEAYNKGYNFDKLLVGGIGGAPGRINVHGPITLNEADAKMLKELADKGVEITFRSNLDEPLGLWPQIQAKYFPNI
jgi:mannose/fructose/N-acetylgalactosamine-specific phosphotransferase system component IIB